MADLDKTIARLLEAYKSAVYAKDVGAFMKLYDPRVRVFDTWGIWSYEGSESWQLAIEAWFTSLSADRVEVTFEDLRTEGDAGFAVISTVVTYAALTEQGEPLRAMQNRLTWVLRTSGHVLRIVHEHTSAPVGFEDGKAILLRTKSS